MKNKYILKNVSTYQCFENFKLGLEAHSCDPSTWEAQEVSC